MVFTYITYIKTSINMKRLLPFILLLLASQCMAQKTYIQCGKLIDGTSNTPLTQMTIVVEGKLITDVQAGYTQGSSTDKIIDLRDKTVMPGLIDCHVHLEGQGSGKDATIAGFTQTDADIAYQAAAYAKTTLMAGFTTVRDLGGSGVNISLRKAIAKGLVVGPRMLTAGRAISASGGHMDPSDGFRDDVMHKMGPDDGVADGRDELVKAVRLQIKRGSDVIKIASTGGVLDLSENAAGAEFTIDEIKAVVETAKDYGLRVACHAHGAEGIRRAILGGVTSIEHGSFMDEEDIKLAKQYGTYYVPTLIAGRSTADSAKIPNYFPPVIARKAIEVSSKMAGTFARAYKAGVKIAFGTDAGVYDHGKNYLEFQYMVEGGMPPMEAIKSATVSAADLLGLSNITGSITKGKSADIVAVTGDPLQDIKMMKNMAFVMKEGVQYK
jgi:imidazolonepropionase-like amidohydrolase